MCAVEWVHCWKQQVLEPTLHKLILILTAYFSAEGTLRTFGRFFTSNTFPVFSSLIWHFLFSLLFYFPSKRFIFAPTLFLIPCVHTSLFSLSCYHPRLSPPFINLLSFSPHLCLSSLPPSDLHVPVQHTHTHTHSHFVLLAASLQ